MTERNMELWYLVDQTNPDDTKQVSFGRTFTSIDPYSQIKRATALWGPMGDRWGADATHDTMTIQSSEGPRVIAICDVRLWVVLIEENERHEYQVGPIRGMCPISDYVGQAKRFKIDDDAGKKAYTDALTKALSYLGFNNDVFRGKFDDVKYVEDRKEKQAQKEEKEQQDQRSVVCDRIIGDIHACTTLEQLNSVREARRGQVKELHHNDRALAERIYSALSTKQHLLNENQQEEDKIAIAAPDTEE